VDDVLSAVLMDTNKRLKAVSEQLAELIELLKERDGA
jgi:hypothetical protein